MKLKDLIKARDIIDAWDKDNFYEIGWPVESMKKTRDELDEILIEVHDSEEFIGQDEAEELLEETINEMNEAISALQTDEENWTLGI